jgi:hypothetical protein
MKKAVTLAGIASILAMPAMPLGVEGASAGEVRFSEHIKPIFNKKCIACHGEVKRAGDVSYISEEGATGEAKSGKRPIVPGDVGASELIHRVLSDDPDERMPPPDEHPEGLSKGEVELLKAWIEEGAVWERHWAYRSPVMPAMPEVDDKQWQDGLDRFVYARLKEEGLAPSPAAKRSQWLRRMTIDLTGLPPTANELREFEMDRSGRAYETVVDRLLGSPAFGERWAAMWLDLARYADSQGYEKDNHRNMWAYRDWVIRALNDDKPFDQFTIAQLAGDLQREPNLDDIIATGFHRNTQTNTEGGTDDEEYRVAAVIDRVNTTWTVWQGVTFGCVQCHSHPYEPFNHDEYYRFFSFFNNSEDCDIHSDFPAISVPENLEDYSRARDLDHQIQTRRTSLNRMGLKLADDAAWFDLRVEEVSGPESVAFDVKGGEVVVGGTVPHGTTYDVEIAEFTGKLTALEVRILPKTTDPAKLPEYGSVLSRFRAEVHVAGGSTKDFVFTDVISSALFGPYDPEDSLKKGASGGGSFPRLDEPVSLIFVPEEPITIGAGDRLHLFLKQDIRNAETKGAVIRRFQLKAYDDDRWTRFAKLESRATSRSEIAALRKEREAIPSATTAPVLVERPENASRETRIFRRGNFLDKDELVSAGVPSILQPSESVDDRLAMAKWLVSAENPLTARVFVNRVWAELFGLGIVETLEDFGSTGTPPSHPELLDYLAVSFQSKHGWRLKSLLRELVLSGTYRQDHRTSVELAGRDRDNRLLARGPRTRLSAEMIRDQALAISGLLSAKMFGPSVMPPQPDGVWSVVYSGAQWKTAKGDDRYRRGLYTYWRRTSPYPSFMTFDAPSREVCTARRLATNTPLQALVTMNDPVYIEAAQGLATMLLRDGGDDISARLRFGYRLVSQSEANATTIEILQNLYDAAVSDYRKSPQEAKVLGESAEAAALVLVANALLNLDAALTK